MNISELESVRPPVRNSVNFTPAEYRAYCMGWSMALERAQAVAELGLEEIELRDRMLRKVRKQGRTA